MNSTPEPRDLLKRAEAYLSALHGSVARHDNLAANLACAGCELRDQIRAAAAAVSVAVPPTRQSAPIVWVDGHPQLEAIAAAVWEKCGRSDSGACVEDDPRNIAVAAYAVVLAVADAEQAEAEPYTFQVWPLSRVLAEVRCGSQDWTWDEEWADLDRRHTETGYLDKLAQDIAANGITMPVLIGTDGRLWDGHHRLRVAVRLGIGYVPVEVPAAAVLPQPETQAGHDQFLTRVLELFSASHADAYGDLFWRVDDGQVQLHANVSDVFAWGGSDCEPITPDTLPALERAYTDLKAVEAEEFTAELYAARQRGVRPQGAAYPSGTHESWRQVNALYDACGPERELGLGNPKAPPATAPAVVSQPDEEA